MYRELYNLRKEIKKKTRQLLALSAIWPGSYLEQEKRKMALHGLQGYPCRCTLCSHRESWSSEPWSTSDISWYYPLSNNASDTMPIISVKFLDIIVKLRINVVVQGRPYLLDWLFTTFSSRGWLIIIAFWLYPMCLRHRRKRNWPYGAHDSLG